MLATMGYITPEVVGKFPGYLSPSKGLAYADIPNGLAAISKAPGKPSANRFCYSEPAREATSSDAMATFVHLIHVDFLAGRIGGAKTALGLPTPRQADTHINLFSTRPC